MELTNEERLVRAIKAQEKIQALGLQIVDSDPWVPCRLHGKEYRLEYSYGAVKEVLRRTGVTIGMDVITTPIIGMESVFLPMLLAGLQTHHSDEFIKAPGDYDANLEKLADMVPMKHRNYYITCISAAIQATEPDPFEMARIAAEARGDDDSQLPLALGSTLESSGRDVEILESPIKT